ncbi:MAG: hypothetical protein RL596_796 [Bacteroidota bacterium]|jgi:hypothetical protein
MEVKKVFLIICLLKIVGLSAQQRATPESATQRMQKKAEKRDKINQLIRQEEEGALIFQKQSAFGIKLNTDGWGFFYEKGKYKTITKTNLWWLEFGEHKNKKEERVPTLTASQGFIVVSNYIYGKRNNFYKFNIGLGQQKLIGGKGNKNGVAVSAIYGGGLSIGMLKPYYIEIQNPSTGAREQIKYSPANENLFLDPTIILGKGGLFKGFSEMEYVPGFHARAALRFDYGRYNEVLSALEVGLKAEYYTKKMPVVLLNEDKQLFFNAYAAIVFGKRK